MIKIYEIKVAESSNFKVFEIQSNLSLQHTYNISLCIVSIIEMLIGSRVRFHLKYWLYCQILLRLGQLLRSWIRHLLRGLIQLGLV